MVVSSFKQCRRGNTLIEFALIAPVFFLVIFGLVEFVLFQFKSNALSHVVYEAARNLQTGEAQSAGDVEQAFMDEACAHASGLIDCEDIRFDVRSYETLGEVTFPMPTFDENGEPENFVFEPGGANEFTAVRAAVHHEFVTPFMAELFGMGPDLPAIVNSFAIVKNEPWSVAE